MMQGNRYRVFMGCFSFAATISCSGESGELGAEGAGWAVPEDGGSSESDKSEDDSDKSEDESDESEEDSDNDSDADSMAAGESDEDEGSDAGEDDNMDPDGSSTGEGEGSSSSTAPDDDPVVGPADGQLVIVGGGPSSKGFAVMLELAGAPAASLVIVPTSSTSGDAISDPEGHAERIREQHGLDSVYVVHTTDPTQADTDDFIAPIQGADAVWFGGGRQWRAVDAYAGTKAEAAFMEVLARGGVIAGSSAGASLQGSFLVRGDTAGAQLVVGDHKVGFGYLRGVGIDQHVAQRGREYDLFKMLEYDASLLGIGLDEATYIVVTGDVFVAGGPGDVRIHDTAAWAGATTDDEKILMLRAGDCYHMADRIEVVCP